MFWSQTWSVRGNLYLFTSWWLVSRLKPQTHSFLKKIITYYLCYFPSSILLKCWAMGCIWRLSLSVEAPKQCLQTAHLASAVLCFGESCVELCPCLYNEAHSWCAHTKPLCYVNCIEHRGSPIYNCFFNDGSKLRQSWKKWLTAYTHIYDHRITPAVTWSQFGCLATSSHLRFGCSILQSCVHDMTPFFFFLADFIGGAGFT